MLNPGHITDLQNATVIPLVAQRIALQSLVDSKFYKGEIEPAEPLNGLFDQRLDFVFLYYVSVS